MEILGISGSLRAASSNSLLLKAATKLALPEMDFSIYDGLNNLPHFSPDLDGETPPEAVTHLRTLLARAAGVIICTPEYAYGMPGSLKNALDWTVSSGQFLNKPVVAISASPGAGGGEQALASLLLTLKALSANVAENGKLKIPLVRTKLNSEGEISDPDTVRAFQSVWATLAQQIQSSR